MPQAQQ